MRDAMTTTTIAVQNFYAVEAFEVYHEDFDFTVLESAEPLPSLMKAVRSACSHAMVTAAAIAFTGILMLPAGSDLRIGMSEPMTVSPLGEPRGGPDIVTMTAYMRERAGLASRVFERTPHPGAEDPEPDYGF
jgi:hypothetical protein